MIFPFKKRAFLFPFTASAVFLSFLVLGFFVHGDFGVSEDEPAMMRFGNETIFHFLGVAPEPATVDWKFHSPLVSVVMVIVQILSHAVNGSDIWPVRHGVTFLFFFFTVLTFFFIARRRYHRWMALIGSIFFILSPRVFAHGMYNPKDIPALFFFTLGVLTFLRLREKWSMSRLALHALACAFLLSLRTFGLLLIVFTLWSILADCSNGKILQKKILSRAGLFLTWLIVLTIAVWPRLWTHSLAHFLEALHNNTSRGGGGLYLGSIYTSTPWHYVPVWIFITTPLLYSVSALIGAIAIIRSTILKPFDTLRKFPHEFLFFLWFMAPIIAVPIFHIGLFNEWRHVLFIYPALLLLSLEGITVLMEALQEVKIPKRIVNIVLVWLIAASTLSTGFWMLRNHPMEYMYFSVPTSLVKGRFEMDYWHLSYRPALEELVKLQPTGSIKVYVSANVALGSAMSLSRADRERIEFVNADIADYIVDDFYTNNYQPRIPLDKALRVISVDHIPVAAIYRGPDTAHIFPEFGESAVLPRDR